MTIIKIFSLFIWLLAVPFCIGLLPMPYLDKRFRTPGAILSSGYILLFTLLEVAGIPVVVFQAYNGFSTFTGWFTAALLVAALSGAGITYWRGKRGYSLRLEGFSSLKGWGFEGRGTLALFLLLVVFQLYMAYTRASFDGDDAYYGAQALAAQQLDTLYRVNPYTGPPGCAPCPCPVSHLGGICGYNVRHTRHHFLPQYSAPYFDPPHIYSVLSGRACAFLEKKAAASRVYGADCPVADVWEHFPLYHRDLFPYQDLAGEVFCREFCDPCGFMAVPVPVWAGGEEKEGGKRQKWFLGFAWMPEPGRGRFQFPGGVVKLPDDRGVWRFVCPLGEEIFCAYKGWDLLCARRALCASLPGAYPWAHWGGVILGYKSPKRPGKDPWENEVIYVWNIYGKLCDAEIIYGA